MFSFSSLDKVLVVAPHPDDESLGTGGLLQRIFAQKIAVRILFATNGENNPWAQRYWEKRWPIGPDERIRWGQRRRQEALQAISTLGGQPDCARFLELPDLGTTQLLMRGDRDLSMVIAEEIRKWEPTVALVPTMLDAHPDHSALSVAFSLALDAVGSQLIRTLDYLVHKPRIPILQEPVNLLLRPEEVECKRKAILCHKTQVALSRGRFTCFAKIEESYYLRKPIGTKTYDVSQEVARLHEGVLSFRFEASKRERFHSQILLAFRSGRASEHRWVLPVPFRSGNVPVWDSINGQRLHDAIIQWGSGRLFVEIPLRCPPDFGVIYAKLSGLTLFFDRSGWNQFPLLANREENLLQWTNVSRLATLL